MEGGAAAALTSSCDVVAVDNPQELDLDNEGSVSSSISLLPLLRVLFLTQTIRSGEGTFKASAPSSSSRGVFSRYYPVIMIASLKVEDLDKICKTNFYLKRFSPVPHEKGVLQNFLLSTSKTILGIEVNVSLCHGHPPPHLLHVTTHH